MGIGVSLFLIAAGATLAFAVADNIDGVDLVALGWILMAVGALGAVLSAVFWSSWGGFANRRTTVIQRERDVL
jgi:Na+/proline symporter